MDADGDGAGVEPVQGVEVVNEGFEEDRSRRNPLRVGDAGCAAWIPGQGPQQLRGAHGAVVNKLASRGEIGRIAPVEAELDNHPGSISRVEGFIEFFHRAPAGLLTEGMLSGPGRGRDQTGVEACRRRDQDGIDVGIIDHVGRISADLGDAQTAGQGLHGRKRRIGDCFQAGAGDAPGD